MQTKTSASTKNWHKRTSCAQRCNPWFRILFSSNPKFTMWRTCPPGIPDLRPEAAWGPQQCRFMVVIGEILRILQHSPKWSMNMMLKVKRVTATIQSKHVSKFGLWNHNTFGPTRYSHVFDSYHALEFTQLETRSLGPKVVLWIHTQPCGHWR